MSKQGELNIDESTIDTVLAEDIDFSGKMHFSKELMIKGKFEGEIDSTGHLIVGSKAIAQAQVKASVVTNYGKVIGNVSAMERFELLNNASLTGDIDTPEIYIAIGCKFNGKCTMLEKRGEHHNHKEPEQTQKQEKK